MKQHKIKVQRTAHYYALGNLNSNTQNVWFVLHGYGQLAKFFLRKFEILEELGDYVIAPEGLSKFYLEKEHKRVGASWMTKEERLDEIEDYIDYLNEVYNQIDIKSSHTINIIGFSQGVATACRWVKRTKCRVSNLILWSGSLPIDLDIQGDAENQFQTYYMYGLQDPYLKNIQASEAGLKNGFLPYKTITFDGGHEISKEVLVKQRNEMIK